MSTEKETCVEKKERLRLKRNEYQKKYYNKQKEKEQQRAKLNYKRKKEEQLVCEKANPHIKKKKNDCYQLDNFQGDYGLRVNMDLSLDQVLYLMDHDPRITNENTLKKNKSDLRMIFRHGGCEKICDCIRNMEGLAEVILNSRNAKTNEPLSESTKSGYFQIIVKAMDNYLTSFFDKQEFQEIHAYFEQYYAKGKNKVNELAMSRKDLPVPSFDEYISNVKKIKDWPAHDKKMALLITNVYSYMTARSNDMSKMKIKLTDDVDDDKTNYISIGYNNKNQIMSIDFIFNTYKTGKNKLKHVVNLDLKDNKIKKIVAVIKDWLSYKKKKIGDFFILDGKPIGPFILKTSKKIGVVNYKNVFRHMRISEFNNDLRKQNLSHDEIVKKQQELADLMMHSPATAQQYMRTISEYDNGTVSAAQAKKQVTEDDFD